VEKIYRLTAKFPSTEQFGLISQIRRAAISIPSNIAEGYGRRSDREYLQFFAIAYGSALELETQLYIARRLGFAESQSIDECELLLSEVIKILYVMVYKRKETKDRKE